MLFRNVQENHDLRMTSMLCLFMSQVTPDPWDLLISRRAKANPQGKEEVRHEALNIEIY